MAYAGRFGQQIYARNFGGIDSKSSLLNIAENEAEDITNWNIGLRGDITTRAGTAVASSIGDNANPYAAFWMPFYDDNGTQRFMAIGKNSAGSLRVYDCDTPGGTYTDRGASGMTVTGSDSYKYIGANWRGAVLVANGTDTPIYHKFGQTPQDLKTASLLAADNVLNPYGYAVGVITGSSNYMISAVTARGETKGVSVTAKSTFWRYDLLTPSGYNILSWTPVDGAISYRIYWSSTDAVHYARVTGQLLGQWALITEVPGSATSWTDSSPVVPAAFNPGSPISPQTSNGAYRTWKDWEVNGWPKGFCVVSRGRSERCLAWRDNYVWASALNNPLDWLKTNDAFAFSVDGGTDKTITGIASLYEYVLIFTRSQCFVYTGSGADDINLEKVIGRGCASHHSIVNVEGDVYFWSDYGPTSFKRIMSGADIESSTDFNKRVQNKVFGLTNTSEWKRISAYRYIPENRVAWAVPGVGQTKNTIAFVYQFDCDGWSKYDNWQFHHCAVTSDYGVFGIREPDSNGSSKLWNLMSGYTDNGTIITATYKTGWYDMRSWETRKRLIWSDVVVDKTAGNYSFTVQWSWDYGIQTSPAVSVSTGMTDGCPIETTSATTAEHRVFADGIGSAFQLVFTSAAPTPATIIGWRPEVRGKGIRK